MPRRPAAFTQADVSRVIRAVRDSGLPVVRVVVRPDGIAVETVQDPGTEREAVPVQDPVADSDRVVVL